MIRTHSARTASISVCDIHPLIPLPVSTGGFEKLQLRYEPCLICSPRSVHRVDCSCKIHHRPEPTLPSHSSMFFSVDLMGNLRGVGEYFLTQKRNLKVLCMYGPGGPHVPETGHHRCSSPVRREPCGGCPLSTGHRGEVLGFIFL